MEELKRRILSDAVVGEGDIIHVDMFLNHCMDINLMEHMGNALAKRFRGVRITKVLTAESSGIALACFVARALDVPAVYAKKFQTGYIDPEVYSAETHSFSLEKSYTLRVSKKYLDGDDVVLLVDDILSNGQAILSLLELVSKAGARWPAWAWPSKRPCGTAAVFCGGWASGWKPSPRWSTSRVTVSF